MQPAAQPKKPCAPVAAYACVQVDRLHVQAVQLREQLEAAALREEQVRLEAQAAAEERFDIALQQQQLKYERQIQVCTQA